MRIWKEKFKFNTLKVFLNWFLNLSLYWKVGFIIGSCFFINLFIAFLFYFLFNHILNLYSKTPIYYEILTEKALAYLESQNQSSENYKRSLEEIIKNLEKAKEEYPQISPQIGKIKASFLQNPKLNLETAKLTREEFLQINQFFKNQRLSQERILNKYKKISQYFSFILFLTIFIFLIWGTWAFYYMVKKPLDVIAENLDYITEETEETELSNLQTSKIRYSFRDEIGKVVNKLNEILKEVNNLKSFKRTIENDETVDLVYERLGYYLKSLVGIKSFIIFEVSNSQNTMKPVYLSDPNLDYSSEILFNADKCRAKRTGQIVNSLVLHEICKIFPFKNLFEYYCIPMSYGGKCIGIISIHFSSEDVSKGDILRKIRKVYAYIKEATPVIEAKRFAEALKEQSFKDALTGIYNRHFLEATLENLVAQILRRDTILGILMCDLDHFKSINDRYGHEAGDLILKETAKLLANNVRKSDLVVRFGGEEFLILLIDVKKEESLKVAEKLRNIIETYEFKLPSGVIKTSISIGVSEFPIDSSSIWEAIKFADVALYKAKESGRNKVVKFKREFLREENYSD